MKILLSGYGRMGKEIEKIALERKHTVCGTIDGEKEWELKKKQLIEADVVIDFSSPDVAVDNIYRGFESKTPVISGTTGWNERINEVRDFCLKNDNALIFASNFSIGVNIFLEINERLASLMNAYDNYDVSIEETHHTQKLDAPSGTAITIANGITNNLLRKNNWSLPPTDNINEIEIIAHRIENTIGAHEVKYTSLIDDISFSHKAHNRKGFALGAVIAAEWIVGKQGFFSMKDVLGIR